MKRQACYACGGPVRMGGGVFCGGCRPRRGEALAVGSVGQRVAAQRAALLLEMVAAPPQQTIAKWSPRSAEERTVLATAAAQQLAAAWGVRLGRA